MRDIATEYRNGVRDFTKAHLTGADLTGAYLAGADLRGADLTGAHLTGADLTGADLTEADLRGADLRGAYLTGADLTEADLRGAYLTEADLRGAYLVGTDLTGADLPHFQISPEVGAFVAFKKLRDKRIAEIVIPADAPRTSSLVGRKCRAAWVAVTALYDMDGTPLPPDTIGIGMHDGTTRYVVGERVEADGWNDDIRVECTHGIHFFMTLREAREYA